MISRSASFRSLTLFLLFLLGAAAASAQQDAWGQPYRPGDLAEQMLAANVANQMGSRDWVPIAVKIVEQERGMMRRLAFAARVDLACGKRYQQNHPSSTPEQYLKYIGTAEGVSWRKTCIAEQLDLPHAHSQLVDGMIATLEVALTVPMMLMEVREQRLEQGLPDRAELTPAMEDALPARARELFASAACLVRKALEKESLSKLVTDPVRLQAPVLAAIEAGDCEGPEVEMAALP